MSSITLPAHCDRCGGPANCWKMSMFNHQMLCPTCQDIERQHPQYGLATMEERAQCRAGNYNFAGIGLPEDLQPKQ